MEGVFIEGLMAEPVWLKIWVGWMILINSLSILFVKNIEARWVLAAWVANGIFMAWLAEQVGYVRLLGLSHIIFWTPLVTYLVLRWPRLELSKLYGRWIAVLVTTNSISLVIDVVDVARYALGDRT